MENGPPRLNRYDVLDGAYISAILRGFRSLGILDSLKEPRTLKYLGDRHGVDEEILGALLEFVSLRSVLFDRIDNTYVRRVNADTMGQEDCILELYLEVYWPNLERVKDILVGAVEGASVVDRVSYAKAFVDLSRAGFPEITDLLNQIGATDVLDIGCGPGSLLIGLAERHADFRGWGVDANPEMCSSANQRIRSSDLSNRLCIFQGNSLEVIPEEVREAVKVITACSVLNEFCTGDKAAMVVWLNQVREFFPRRVLIVADYHGELDGIRSGGTYQMAKLHDVVQVLSGQGVPPSELSGWERIYGAAGCTLMHVVDFDCLQFRRFVHFVWLGSQES
jgi:SAM-dependent methyltransferase